MDASGSQPAIFWGKFDENLKPLVFMEWILDDRKNTGKERVVGTQIILNHAGSSNGARVGIPSPIG